MKKQNEKGGNLSARLRSKEVVALGIIAGSDDKWRQEWSRQRDGVACEPPAFSGIEEHEGRGIGGGERDHSQQPAAGKCQITSTWNTCRYGNQLWLVLRGAASFSSTMELAHSDGIGPGVCFRCSHLERMGYWLLGSNQAGSLCKFSLTRRNPTVSRVPLGDVLVVLSSKGRTPSLLPPGAIPLRPSHNHSRRWKWRWDN